LWHGFEDILPSPYPLPSRERKTETMPKSFKGYLILFF